ncbi:MAG TPA: CBS domain-containing protein [Candidatus Sulfotelmatobacter sp.]|jgi:CBS domain-containing protein|nr:CBS domain-containing protein [Candidatus Sulfotelmatobacter sp.]
MKVSDLPPGRLLSVSPQTRLADVAREMRLEDSDSAAVMEGGRLVGIITERDLVRAIAEGVNPTQASAEVIMTPNPATVSGDEDVSVVALKMMRLGIRHLPVVDDEGKPVGLVSARNLVAVLDRASS